MEKKELQQFRRTFKNSAEFFSHWNKILCDGLEGNDELTVTFTKADAMEFFRVQEAIRRLDDTLLAKQIDNGWFEVEGKASQHCLLHW